jgi:hypothetical protein
MMVLEISSTTSVLTLIVQLASSVPKAFACLRHGLGPPWGRDERTNLGLEAHSDHDEELAELGKSGLEGRTRRAAQSFHGLGRTVRRDREVVHDRHAHLVEIAVDSYVRNRSDRKHVGWRWQLLMVPEGRA